MWHGANLRRHLEYSWRQVVSDIVYLVSSTGAGTGTGDRGIVSVK